MARSDTHSWIPDESAQPTPELDRLAEAHRRRVTDMLAEAADPLGTPLSVRGERLAAAIADTCSFDTIRLIVALVREVTQS